MADWNQLQNELLEALLNEDEDAALSLARQALAEGATPTEFFTDCITPALVEIGNRFESLDIYLPEMVVAAEIVQRINDEVIQPQITAAQASQAASQGKVLLAMAQGDLHDIGKNMVALLLRVNGFEVVDLGINVPPQDIVAGAEREQVDIIGMSSLLTTCLPYMKDTMDLLHARGLRGKYAVIVGGAASTPEFSARIGVDAQGHTAAEAVRICRSIMAERRQPAA
jgi:methylmalonyl-CoA mutase cobalamin-binding domain/chain